jgi:anhydro-N-acetylmuramic acid kinase
MEVGEPAIIAERTRTLVVCELRPSDIAAGGHGAPLSAFVDHALFADQVRGRAIQNIGGIANVTYLPPGATLDDILAFDTGPGNMVIDGVVQRLTDGRDAYDADGQWAARGTIHQDLLDELMRYPYIAKSVPKTTGREDFGDPFIEYVLSRAVELEVAHDDLVATVTAFTAACIHAHYERELIPRGRLNEAILYGGGAHNRTLVDMIARRLAPVRVRMHDEFGIPGDAREAVTWAMLADETLAGHAGNVPAASGARHPVVLGKIVDLRPRDA